MKQQVLDFISNLTKLPSIPDVSLEIISTLQNETSSLQDAVKIIRRDPALVMKIMQVANSSRFGGSMKISALEIAAGRLGMRVLRQIAVVSSFHKLFPSSNVGYNTQQYWEHSLSSALVSEYVMSKSDLSHLRSGKMELFTASLLHGIGLLVLQFGFPQETLQIVKKLEENPGSITDIERDVLGVTYNECGEILCRNWELPQSIIDAVRWHSEPGECPESSRQLCELVYLSLIHI